MCLLHCVDIYTDGAVVMAGKLLSRLAEIKAEAANSTHSHCILHLQAPIIKKLYNLGRKEVHRFDLKFRNSIYHNKKEM